MSIKCINRFCIYIFEDKISVDKNISQNRYIISAKILKILIINIVLVCFDKKKMLASKILYR